MDFVGLDDPEKKRCCIEGVSDEADGTGKWMKG